MKRPNEPMPVTYVVRAIRVNCSRVVVRVNLITRTEYPLDISAVAHLPFCERLRISLSLSLYIYISIYLSRSLGDKRDFVALNETLCPIHDTSITEQIYDPDCDAHVGQFII